MKSVNFLTRVLRAGAGLSLLGMMVLTCADVVGGLFDYPILGSEEVVALLGALLLAFALPVTEREKGHVGVDLVYRLLSDNVKKAFDIVVSLASAAFFLLAVSEYLLRFFIGFNKYLGVQPVITLQSHVSLMTSLMLVFGLAFQTPLVVVVLAKMGLVTMGTLNHYRRHVIVSILILAAFATSPSPVDQILLAVPMWLLYEMGVLLVYLFVSKKSDPSV